MKKLIQAYVNAYVGESDPSKKEVILNELVIKIYSLTNQNKTIRNLKIKDFVKEISSLKGKKQKDIADYMGKSVASVSQMINREKMTLTNFMLLLESLNENISINTTEGIEYKIEK